MTEVKGSPRLPPSTFAPGEFKVSIPTVSGPAATPTSTSGIGLGVGTVSTVRQSKKLIQPYNQDQVLHFSNMLNLARYAQVSLDTSPTGGGKTYAAGYVAQQGAFKLLPLCPKHTMQVWEDLIAEYGIDSAGVFNFEKQRPEAKHPETQLVRVPEGKWTTATEVEDEDEEATESKRRRRRTRKPTDAEATDFLRAILRSSKTLIVIDEYHRAKTADTATTILVRAIIRAVRQHNRLIDQGQKLPIARVIMASATPYDSQAGALTFLRTVGIVPTAQLVVRNEKNIVTATDGYDSLITFCNNVLGHPFLSGGVSAKSKDEYRAWLSTPAANPRNYASFNDIEAAYFLSSKIVEPALSSTVKVEPLRYGRNLFVSVDPRDRAAVMTAIYDLQHVSGYDPERGVVNSSPAMMGKINVALRNVEAAKLSEFVDTAMRFLTDAKNPNDKVIMFMKYKVGVVNTLMQYFSDQSTRSRTRTLPLELTGDIDDKKRQEIKRTFNAHNDQYRLLICTLATGGESISLHDTSPGGKFPRRSLISPTFSAIEQIQAAGRTDRTGTTSTPYVYFVFSGVPYPEARVIKALQRRYDILRTHISARSNAKPITLPDEYPSIIEGVSGEYKLDEAIALLSKTLTVEDQQLLATLASKSSKKVPVVSGRASSRSSEREGEAASERKEVRFTIPSVAIPTFTAPIVVSSSLVSSKAEQKIEQKTEHKSPSVAPTAFSAAAGVGASQIVPPSTSAMVSIPPGAIDIPPQLPQVPPAPLPTGLTAPMLTLPSSSRIAAPSSPRSLAGLGISIPTIPTSPRSSLGVSPRSAQPESPASPRSGSASPFALSELVSMLPEAYVPAADAYITMSARSGSPRYNGF